MDFASHVTASSSTGIYTSRTASKRPYSYENREDNCEQSYIKKTRIIDYHSDESSRARNRCNIKNCDFCLYGVSVLMKYEMRKQGWKQRLVVAFNSVERTSPSFGAWHSLNAEIYPFLESHWDALWCGAEREKDDLWKKKIQDCLTHNKDTFESGVSQLGKKGFWRIAKYESKSTQENEIEFVQFAPDSPTRRYPSAPGSPKRTPKQYYASLPKVTPPVVIQQRSLSNDSPLLNQLNTYKAFATTAPTTKHYNPKPVTVDNTPKPVAITIEISTPISNPISINDKHPILNKSVVIVDSNSSDTPKFNIINSKPVGNLRVDKSTTLPHKNFPQSNSTQHISSILTRDDDCAILPPILFDTKSDNTPNSASSGFTFNFDSEFKRFCERSNSISPFSKPIQNIRK